MRHPIVVLLLVAFGIGLAIAGGPVLWAVLVMLSPPLILFMLRGSSPNSTPNPHFAVPPPRPPRSTE